MNTLSSPAPQLLLPAPKPQLLLPAPQPALEPEPVATQPPDFVDVSHHQGDIDWKQYAASGRKLAVCKITEGGDFNDTKAQMFRAGMADAGLKTGIYHFARPNAANLLEDADLEAKHYLEQVGTLRPNEFPVLDFEVYKGLTASQLTDWANRWCETVETSTGKTPWLYTNNKILHTVDATKLSRYPLWLADYRTSDRDNPPPAAPWPKLHAWQFTDKADVAGMPGKVDGNYLYGPMPT